MTDKTQRGGDPGAAANRGFGAPGSPTERDRGEDRNAPARKEQEMKTPANDGLDPKALEKEAKSDPELMPEEQLDEDISVTGAPPKDDRAKNAPDV